MSPSEFPSPVNPEHRNSDNLEESVAEVDDRDGKSPVNMPSHSKPWMKLAGMGMELASYTLGLAAVGYAFDHYQGQDTGYGVAIGILVGFAFGMFRFIQKAMREIQSQYK